MLEERDGEYEQILVLCNRFHADILDCVDKVQTSVINALSRAQLCSLLNPRVRLVNLVDYEFHTLGR